MDHDPLSPESSPAAWGTRAALDYLTTLTLILLGTLTGASYAWVNRPGVGFSGAYQPTVQDVLEGLRAAGFERELALGYVLRVAVGAILGAIGGFTLNLLRVAATRR